MALLARKVATVLETGESSVLLNALARAFVLNGPQYLIMLI